MEAYAVRVYPWAVAAVVAALLAAAASQRRELRAVLGGPFSRRGASVLLAIAAAAAILRLFVLPHGHRIFFDEFEHMDLARNLARHAAFGRTVVSDALYAPLQWGAGLHVVLAAVYRVFGEGAAQAFILNGLLGAAAVLLCGLAAAAAFDDERAGCFAAALLAVFPAAVQFSTTADTTSAGAASLALALCALFVHERTRGAGSAALWALAAAYAAHCRQESALLIPLGALFLRSGRGWAAAAGAAVLVAPLAAVVLHMRWTGKAGYAETFGQTLSYLAVHLKGNILGFAVFAPAALIIAAAALAPRSRRSVLLWACGAAYLLIYSAYRWGDLFHATENRYSVAVFLPWAVAAGAGLARLRPRWAAGAALALYTVLCRPGVPAMIGDIYRAELELLDWGRSALPADAWAVAFNTSAITAGAGRRAVGLEVFLNDERRAEFLKGKGDLYLLADLWWHEKTEVSQRILKATEKDYRFEPVKIVRTGSTEYGFYKLSPYRSSSR